MMDERPESVGPFSGLVDCLLRPRSYFAQMPRDLGYGAPLARVAVWACLSALFGLLLKEGVAVEEIARRPWAVFLWLSQSLLFQLGASFLSAGVFHLMCKGLGGAASYQASFRAVAALSVLGPAIEAAALVPFYGLAAMCLAGLAYWTAAAVEVHGVRPGRACAVFGVLGAVFLALAVWVSLI